MKSAMEVPGVKASRRTHGINCRAKGCKNSNNNSSLSFFGFPRDNRTAAWIAYADRQEYADLPPEQLKHRKLCAVHFAANAFANKQRTSLKRTAVPTVPRETASSSVPVLSCSSSSSGDATPAASHSHTSEVESSSSKDLWKTSRAEWRKPQQDRVCSKDLLGSGLKGGPRISPKEVVVSSVFLDKQQKIEAPILVPGNVVPVNTTETVIYVTLNETDEIMPLNSRNDSDNETDKGMAETLRDCVKPVISMNGNVSHTAGHVTAQSNVVSGHNYSKLLACASLNLNCAPAKVGRPKSLTPKCQDCRRHTAAIERLKRQKNELKLKLQQCMKRQQVYSLKEIENDQKEGSERAAFLVDQLQNYQKKSPRWSDTTIRRCILWSNRLRSGYTVLQSSKVIKLPTIATLKKYIVPTNADSATELAVSSLEHEANSKSLEESEICAYGLNDHQLVHLP
ncbi:uncharacterized protein LOC135396448 [Ornithodoros turicata]|uniref:uncharacterized protein LOC135396448 n=1 Tax=Ornithodoros turicata TaxID=34597 RepID=UPI0031388649